MINASFSMNLTAFKSTFFSAVMDPVQRAIRKNSEILAGQIRRTEQNSMKRSGKLSKKKTNELIAFSGNLVSMPGQPPLAHVGLLKDHIYYGWDAEEGVAVVGAAKLRMPGTVPASLEFGKPSVTTKPGKNGARIPIQIPIKARPYAKPAAAKILTPSNIAKVYAKSIKARKGF